MKPAPGPSARAAAVPSFQAMDVMSAAAAVRGGARVLHLEVGQPSAGAPAGARAAAAAALAGAPTLGYTPALGGAALREAVGAMCHERYGVRVAPAEVAVTTGGTGGFLAVFMCLFDTGDRVCCPVPGYPCYRNTLAGLGVDVVTLETEAAEGHVVSVAALAKIPDLKGLVLASPNNPNGGCLSRTELAELAAHCDARGIHLVCDEIYHGLTYMTAAASALEVPRAIIVSSFSKFWCLAGWRVGFIVCRDPTIMNALERVLQNIHISAPALSQLAAAAALLPADAPELAGHVARYRRNLEVLVDALPPLGFREVRMPDGAFYLYVEAAKVMERLGVETSLALCHELLRRVHVAISPGTDFDPVRGKFYVRFSAAGAETDIKEAAKRLTNLLH